MSDGLDDAARAHLEACFALVPILKIPRNSSNSKPVLELAEALGVGVPKGSFID